MNAGEEWTERRRRGTTTAPQQSQALIMASATPVSSEGGTSISARAARGVRGFQHDAESPQVADAVIEAQRNARSFCATENSQPVRSYCETGLHCTPESGRRPPRASLRSPAGRVSRRAEDTLTRAEAPHYALGLLAPWEYA